MPKRREGRYTINTTKPCPKCGAKAVRAGELTFRRNGGRKWFGPFIEFECGLMLVFPGAGTKAEMPPETWNVCANMSGNGKPVVDIPKGDYEIRKGKPFEPETSWGTLKFSHNGYIFVSATSASS